MKIKKYIFQGLSLLMLVFVFNTQVSVATMPSHVYASSQDGFEDDQLRSVQHVATDSVALHYNNYSFGYERAFLGSFKTGFVFLKEDVTPAKEFLFSHDSYFNKIFERLIAINAP